MTEAGPIEPDWARLAQENGTHEMLTESDVHGWYFRARGQTRASLVCLHGIQTHGAWFAPLSMALTPNGYSLWCPDRRGSGIDPGNDRVARIKHYETWVEDVKAVITEARKDGAPVYLVGTSWGAKTALEVIAEDPAAVNGTILLVPALMTTKETLFEKLRTGFGYWFAPDRALRLPLTPSDYIPYKDRCEPMSMSNTKLLSEMEKDTLLLHSATPRFHGEAIRMQKHALKALAKHIRPSPIHMIFAGKDKIVKKEASGELLRKPNCRTTEVVLPDQGHGVQIENPDKIAIEIEHWIQDQRSCHM